MKQVTLGIAMQAKKEENKMKKTGEQDTSATVSAGFPSSRNPIRLPPSSYHLLSFK